MAFKYDETTNQLDLTGEDDGILPVDSASNISAPTSMTSSMARQYRNQRAAAALKLKMIEEEAVLEEMERNIEITTVCDERELRRKRRAAKIEADLLAAKMKAEKDEMEAKAKEIEEEEAIKKLEAEQRRKSVQAEKKETGGSKGTFGS